ncbi:MAG: hypothetical protein ACJAS1_001631 [Oleiphilaceae bacterium]|jgi:hypothetical protein
MDFTPMVSLKAKIMLIPLERLKTNTGQKWLKNKLDRKVRIIGGGWYWRPKRAGYTDSVEHAGVYTMGDAWNASAHCGEEKGIMYEFCDNALQVTQEPSGKDVLLLRSA